MAWLTPWNRKQVISINNTGLAKTLTNYKVRVDVLYNSEMNADFSDIRFTNTDGTTLLNHYRDSYTASTQAVFWVEIPTITASVSVRFYMYYGNAAAATASDAAYSATSSSMLWSNETTQTSHSEHPIIKDGKLYVTAQAGAFLAIYDIDSGALLNSYSGAYQSVCAPIIDASGYIHLYCTYGKEGDYIGMIKLNETTGAISETKKAASGTDYESLAYDAANDAIIFVNTDKVYSLNCSDYSVRWQYSFVTNIGCGSSPVIAGNYVYFRSNHTGKICKIHKDTGTAKADLLVGDAAFFSLYNSTIYDADHDTIYTYGHTNEVVAVACNGDGEMGVAWRKILGAGGEAGEGAAMTTPILNYTGCYNDGKLFQGCRDHGDNYKSKMYCLDVTDDGSVLWTNTTAWDLGHDQTNFICDDNYLIVPTLHYVDIATTDEGKILIISQLDGSLLNSNWLPNGTSCHRPNVSGGYTAFGLCNGTELVYKIGTGNVVDSINWGGNIYHNGFVGTGLGGGKLNVYADIALRELTDPSVKIVPFTKIT